LGPKSDRACCILVLSVAPELGPSLAGGFKLAELLLFAGWWQPS
jgi:hypothetical protein